MKKGDQVIIKATGDRGEIISDGGKHVINPLCVAVGDRIVGCYKEEELEADLTSHDTMEGLMDDNSDQEPVISEADNEPQ